MKTKTMILLALAGAVGLVARASAPIAAAKSPDGRNEIRLYASPLAYEVLRDGVTLAARAEIGLTVDGKPLAQDAAPKGVVPGRTTGTVQTPVYKKDAVDLSGNETFVDFGDWGVRLAARDDGVAYRFETKRDGQVTVDAEQAGLAIPDAAAKCWVCETGRPGCEESVPVSRTARDLRAAENSMYYLPFVYTVGGKCVAVTESDVRDYPVWNLVSSGPVADNVARFGAKFECAAKSERHSAGGKDEPYKASGGRWVRIQEHEKFLVRTSGARTFPWRTFVLTDAPAKLCEADIVYALAPAPEAGADFSWVKPGKVAWDWWNCFDNAPRGTPNGGCTTKTYERFIDFAQKSGVEYVIFDEGWSKSLDIWNFHPQVDVPHLIEYANARGVGIILWMAWAQVCGDEEKVAEHFAKLGAKGFKVDFMDRGDAGVTRFLEKFAAACAKRKMLVDYHGVYRPTGLHRRYPNIVNYEGVHGLENMKWHGGRDLGAMFNDVAAFFLRMTAGPMDFTPGAMLNHAVGGGYRGAGTRTPGSVGTRCRQMAMMALYEAPLQMLCDSPTNYERNMECFSFMAGTPVVWSRTLGLGGCPDTYALAARQAKDGTWYAGAINTAQAKSVTLDTAFLGAGEFEAEIFRDAPDCWNCASKYVRETKRVTAGEKLVFDMAPGGGFVVRFAKAKAAAAATAAKAPLKVLMIGNSFSVQMVGAMPPVAKNLGCALDICSLYIGGCSLERHWKNVCAPDTTPYAMTRTGCKPSRGNIPSALKSEKWDVVTIQQASHFSWRPESYHPWGDDLVKYIRENAPQAKIVVQETWSYTPWDGRLAKWQIDQNEMYEKLHAAYGDFAKRYGFEVIPTGTAVQLVRRELPVKYAENSLGGDVVGSCTFVEKDGKWSPKGDVFHMGPDGNYLQALVWTAKLFGVDVTKCTYRPKRMGEERAAFLRRMAMKAVRH